MGSHLLTFTSALVVGAIATAQAPADKSILFTESFDDAQLIKRGFYDGDKFAISDQKPFAGKGCIEYKWKAGGTNPSNSSGMRRIFEPTESVYLKYHIRVSKNWGWSGRNYHPHLTHFMTTENGQW